jgi:hypothetical protein
MLAAWVSIALTLYAVPVFVWAAARADASRSAAEVALDLVTAVAFDLVSIIVAAKWMTLETAVLLSRGLWIGALPFVFYRKRAPIKEWLGAHRRAVFTGALGLTLALLVSCTMSMPFAVWDRQWHIPLVGSLRGQRTPFWNVYENGGQLFYHYAGDVLASALQILSFDHMHASSALSRAHDVMFALTGLLLGLILPTFAQRRILAIVATIGATLLAGPATLLREGAGRPSTGHSIINLLTLSFRPHVSLSFLLIFGFSAAVLLPIVSERPVSRSSTVPALFASTALLAITDEASLAVLGLMLGAIWLLAPGILAKSRLRGAGVMTGLVVTIGLVIVLLGGVLGRGAPRHSLSPVPLQVPGFYAPSFPLSTSTGRSLLFFDFLLVFGTLIAGIVAVLATRRRRIVVTFVAYAVLFVVSMGLLTGLNTDGDGLNNHRFVTTLLLVSPLFGAYWLSLASGLATRYDVRPVLVSVLFLATVPSVFSTIEWLLGPAKNDCESHKGFWGDHDFYSTDCRQQTAAVLGEVPQPTYVANNVWYLYAGCRPLFAPGPDVGQDNLQLIVSTPLLGAAGLQKLDRWVARDGTIRAYCAPGDASDPICAHLSERGRCAPVTTELSGCALSHEARQDLLEPKQAR